MYNTNLRCVVQLLLQNDHMDIDIIFPHAKAWTENSPGRSRCCIIYKYSEN